MAGPFDLDTPRWSSGELCAAAGVDPTTFERWVRCKPPVIAPADEERATRASGGRPLFTLRQALQVALAREFVEQGFTPRRAGLAASVFTERAGPGRPAGHLFPEGWTVLLAHRRNGTWAIKVDPEATLGSQVLQHPIGPAAGGTFVLVNRVHARVVGSLQQQPQARCSAGPNTEPAHAA